jgi:hypothetical protein
VNGAALDTMTAECCQAFTSSYRLGVFPGVGQVVIGLGLAQIPWEIAYLSAAQSGTASPTVFGKAKVGTQCLAQFRPRNASEEVGSEFPTPLLRQVWKALVEVCFAQGQTSFRTQKYRVIFADPSRFVCGSFQIAHELVAIGIPVYCRRNVFFSLTFNE